MSAIPKSANKMDRPTDRTTRAEDNEKRLMAENKALKRKLSDLSHIQSNLAKERHEVKRLKENAAAHDSTVQKLKEDRDKTKAEMLMVKIQRDEQKKDSSNRIQNLQKLTNSWKGKWFNEKKLREKMEAEIVSQAENEKKHSASQLEKLKHANEELSGFKSFATKKIEEQDQIIREQNSDLESLLDEVTETKEDLNSCKIKLNEMIAFKEKGVILQKELDEKTLELKSVQERRRKKEREYMKQIATLQKMHENVLQKQKDERNYQKEITCIELELQKQKDITKEQDGHILTLERKLEESICQKNKLQLRDKQRSEEFHLIDMHMHKIKLVHFETENKLRRSQIEAEITKGDKKLSLQNLFVAHAEICKMDEQIKQLVKKNSYNMSVVDAKVKEVITLKKENHSLKLQLKKKESKLNEAAEGMMATEQNMAKLSKMKNKLHKELSQAKELLVSQQHTYQVERVSQEQRLDKYKTEIADLKKSMEKVQSALSRSRRERIQRDRKKLVRPRLAVSNMNRVYQVLQKNENEKVKMIEELKAMLKRRPSDAIEKLQRCKWDNRELRKKLMATQGHLYFCETQVNKGKEKNQMLTDELRKLKLDQYTATRLPPVIKKKTQSASLDLKEQGKPSPSSEKSCFPALPPEVKVQSQAFPKTFALPPIARRS